MRYGELVTLDGTLFVKSSLDCHKDSPLKKVLRGYETFNGDYYFVTEEPDEFEMTQKYPRSFGFIQTIYGWEWGWISEKQFGKGRSTGWVVQSWSIKKSDLPYAGKRGDYN